MAHGAAAPKAAPSGLNVDDENTASSTPDMNQFGVQSLTLHDARKKFRVAVEASTVFEFGKKDISELRLWDVCRHFCLPGQPLPKPFLRGPTYTFPATNDHWTATQPDYLKVSFNTHCAVYLFTVNIAHVPLWIRRDFRKVSEAKVALAIKWKLSPHIVILATMSQKLAACRGARLNLWEYKHTCNPEQVYKFGGNEGSEGVEDYTYLFCWRPLGRDELAQSGGGVPAVQDGVPDVAKAADIIEFLKRRTKYLEQIVKAVYYDDCELLQEACEAYPKIMASIAEHSAAARSHSAHEHALSPRPSFLTASGRPLTSVATERNVQPKLILYLVSQGAELDTQALSFLLTHKSFPAGGYRDVRHFMLSYVMHQRNPIASAMAFGQVLDEQGALFSSKKDDYGALAGLLRSLAVEMTKLLVKLNVVEPRGEEAEAEADGAAVTAAEPEAAAVGGVGGAVVAGAGAAGKGAAGPAAAKGGDGDGGPPATLADVLDPRGVACSLNDYSSLQVAYETNDLEFMSTSVVQGHLQNRWLGADYIANALQDKGNNINYSDHHFTLIVLQNAGFVGSVGRQLVQYLSYMSHLMLLAARPFFDSPRGRWVFRLLCEAFLLYVFHSVQLTRDQTRIAWQHVVLVLYVASMVVDELQEVMHQYRGRLALYFSNGFNLVEATAMSLLIGSGACKAAMLALGDDHPHWEELLTAKDFLFNTVAIFMWARLLQYIIPLYDGVGSLLMVISKMIREVFKFAVPGMILLLGVAFTMYSTFRDRDVGGMDSFPVVVLLLFRTFLGETMFGVMEEESTTLYNVYGNIIVLLYALTATVVLANLLIALISHHFKPDEVKAQSHFQRAEITAHYEYMVENQLMGAPFSLPQLLLVNLLPSGWRRMAPSASIHSCGIMPPDGDPEAGESREAKLYPTGSREVPYLIFLLTAYPVVVAIVLSMYTIMAPYCILYFALYGYRIWVPTEELPAADYTDPPHAAEAADGGSGEGGRRSGHENSKLRKWTSKVSPDVPAGKGRARGMEEMRMVEMAYAAAAAEAQRVHMPPPPAGGAAAAAATAAEGGSSQQSLLEAGSRAFDADELAFGPGSNGMYPEWNTKQRMLGLCSLLLRTLAYIVTRPLWIVVGAFVYLVVIGFLILAVWLGVYQWLGRLAFTCYCVGHGWTHGWFGSGRQVIMGDQTAAPGGVQHSSASSGGGGGAASSLVDEPSRGLLKKAPLPPPPPATPTEQRITWVRTYQKRLRNGGQVLSRAEVSIAMGKAGCTEKDVEAAESGAGEWTLTGGDGADGAAAAAGGKMGTWTAAGRGGSNTKLMLSDESKEQRSHRAPPQLSADSDGEEGSPGQQHDGGGKSGDGDADDHEGGGGV